MERSLVLIKPDAVQRGLAGAIISRLEQRGLKIVAMKMLRMDKALAERHYAIHKDKPFFKDLVDFITSSPIIATVFEGGRSVEIIRQSMGATDPLKAAAGSIRCALGLDMQQNLVHGSDSVENAAKEISIFFKPEEIMNYTKDMDKWI
jgi:nucleoside-diphosphate kinase